MTARGVGDGRGAPRRRPDLAAVAADDRLIDALGRGVPMGVSAPGAGSSGDPVPGLLAAWVDSIDSGTCDGRVLPPRRPHPSEGSRIGGDEPDNAFVIALPDSTEEPDDPAGMPKARRTAAAAAVAATVGLFGLIQVEQAEPGSVWWPLVELLDADRADSAVAQDVVQKGLSDVNAMVNDGRAADAAQELERLEAELPKVLPEDGQADLAAQMSAMHEQIAALAQPPAGAMPDYVSNPAAPFDHPQPVTPGAQPQPAGHVPPGQDAAGADAGRPHAPAPAGGEGAQGAGNAAQGPQSTPPAGDQPPQADEPPAEPGAQKPRPPSFDWALGLLYPSGSGAAPPASGPPPNSEPAPPAEPSTPAPPSSAPGAGSQSSAPLAHVGAVLGNVLSAAGIPDAIAPGAAVPPPDAAAPGGAPAEPAQPTQEATQEAQPTHPAQQPLPEAPQPVPEPTAQPTTAPGATEAPAPPPTSVAEPAPGDTTEPAAPQLLPGIPPTYLAPLPTDPAAAVPPPSTSSETGTDSTAYQTSQGMPAY